MAFRETVAQLPFTPQTQNGRGFLPPMVRAMGHIMFLDASLADENVPVTEEEALTELRHAQEHWNARAATQAVSTTSLERSTLIGTALTEAIAEYHGWDEQTRVGNLRDLTHRVLQYTADLDRETVGLPDSDAGTAL